MKIRGFRIGRRIFRMSGRIIRKTLIRRSDYTRLCPTRPEFRSKPIDRFIRWGRRLRKLCSAKPRSGYLPVGQDLAESKPDPVPKGHLAVYVGQKDGDFHRVTVPVVYFNHPLFGELLKEAEEEYGFCHDGGITIPCPFRDFERVKTRIAAVSGTRMWTRHRNSVR